MNNLKFELEQLAINEMIEHFYGVDTSTPDYDEYRAEIEGLNDPEEYSGYWNFEALDTDWPAFSEFRMSNKFAVDYIEIPF